MPVTLPELVSISNSVDLAKPIQGTAIGCSAGEFRLGRFLLTDGPSQGVELLVVQTDRVRAAICPTRGMSLWKANIDGVNCGWNSPVEGPIHPSLVKLSDSNGLGWLDGFDELMVRCGMQSFGAPEFDDNGQLLFPLHGRVGNIPARNLEVSVDEAHSLLEVTAEIHETRFLQFNLRLKAKYIFNIGEPTIEVRDVVRNAGATPTTCQMLYHINVGSPILEGEAQASITAERCVARNEHAAKDIDSWRTYLAPTPGYSEQVYFFEGKSDEQNWAHAMLQNKASDVGFAVRYKTDSLPYFTQWKNTVGTEDGYVTGLEPGTGFPNPRGFEETQGRLLELATGEEREFHLAIDLLKGSQVVSRAGEISNLANQAMPTVEFDAKWCAK